jgi:hypothetical protein
MPRSAELGDGTYSARGNRRRLQRRQADVEHIPAPTGNLGATARAGRHRRLGAQRPLMKEQKTTKSDQLSETVH